MSLYFRSRIHASSVPATFSSTLLFLIDRGFVHAVAHVRGGQEKGRAWYEAARFGSKHHSRVTYWEPAKWVARHRQRRTDTVPLYLKTNMSSGHFGETGRYASLAECALEQAFALKIMGWLPDGHKIEAVFWDETLDSA